MKKKYISPLVEEMNMGTENVIAASMQFYDDEQIAGDNALGRDLEDLWDE